MVNYQNARIYKIIFDGESKYVGSTTVALKNRLGKHKEKVNCVVKKEGDKIGWENVRIVLIEKYPCEDREELVKREQYWMDKLRPSLNRNRAHKCGKKTIYREVEASTPVRIKFLLPAVTVCQMGKLSDG